jgi:hypothetical protein
MIAEKPKFVVGDTVIVYIRRPSPRTAEELTRPSVKTVTIESIGLTGSVWTYNYDTDEPFTAWEVEYVLQWGRWKSVKVS